MTQERCIKKIEGERVEDYLRSVYAAAEVLKSPSYNGDPSNVLLSFGAGIQKRAHVISSFIYDEGLQHKPFQITFTYVGDYSTNNDYYTMDSFVVDGIKVPLLGELPVLGALFRSNSYQKKKTDLMIAITPHLVSPTKEGRLSFPGEFVNPPSRLEFYLMGKLEGERNPEDVSNLSGHHFSSYTSGGLDGSFGHIEQ